MAVDDRPGRRSEDKDPPREFPQTPPPQLTDWSWSLQMLMELQKTVGKLSQSVEMLTRQNKEHEKKLDRISHGIYAAVAVLTVVGGVLLWVLDAVSDEIVTVVKEALLRSAE